MKIRMIHTMSGSPDGLTIYVYEADQIYDLPSSLARIFLEEGWAREDKAMNKVPEVKASGRARKRSDAGGSQAPPPSGDQ
ncbi:hypothetical protein J2Z48_002102 [Croceifilum oryzae]|uniref:Uncharacterized protein n=1 Tax=Croceifilum oryzae TaxID=1553429 RepID=A0AAJ1TFG8_9BACL|nr:hypothetical protein [Croceifilum oryzae]MDQ0417918.1 hypothetical protein [Croceifilum oryzae]